MAAQPKRIALVGAGLFATQAYLPALGKLKDKYITVAVYSRSLSSASALAKTAAQLLGVPEASLALYHDQGGSSADLDALLNSTSVGAVVITLPITVQPAVVLAALRAGKHVLSEKPVAADVSSGHSLITEYQEKYAPNGLHWRIAENFECAPGLIKAAEAIQAGRIGKVSHWRLRQAGGIEADNQCYKTSWRTVPEYQGGFLLDGGVHYAAAIRTVLSGAPKELSGFASLTRGHLAPHDTIHSIIRWEDGSHGLFDLSFALPRNAKTVFDFTVMGSEGMLHILDEKKDGKDAWKVIVHSTGGNEETIAWEEESGVLKELEYFAELLDGKDSGKGLPGNALLDVAVIQASLTSEGNPVYLLRLVGGQ